MNKRLIILVSAFLWYGVYSFAASYLSKVEDTSVAWKMWNNDDSDMTLTVTSAGAHAAMIFTVDGHNNSLDGSGSALDDVNEWEAALLASTNVSGTTASALGLRIYSKTSLGTDSTDGELLNGVYTVLADGGVAEEVLWDTSAHKSYDVHIPAMDHQASMFGHVSQPMSITRITGLPGGTSNLTTSVYIDRALVFQRSDVITGSATVNLNTEVNIPIKPSQGAIVRSTRTTTATTGVLGITVE